MRSRNNGAGQLWTFDFLGFTRCCDRTRKGKFELGRKKLWQKVEAMNQWLRKMRNLLPLKEWWKIFGIKLIGHYRDFGISRNLQARFLERHYITKEVIKYVYSI